VPPDPTAGAFLEGPSDWAGVYHRVEPVGDVIPATTRSPERLEPSGVASAHHREAAAEARE